MIKKLRVVASLILFSTGLHSGETELNLPQLQAMTAVSVEHTAVDIAGPVAVADNTYDLSMLESSSDESELEQEFLSHQILPETNKVVLPEFLPARLPETSPLIIGHRGFGTKTFPEPDLTPAAFRRGFALGADAVEIDVQLSKDGALMLTHNSDIDQVTTYTGCVADYTRRQLQSVPLLDGQARTTAERMAILEDVLPLLREQAASRENNADAAIVAMVHIKVFDGFHGDWPGIRRLIKPCPRTNYSFIARKTLDAVKDAGLADKIMFVSFDHRVLDTIRSLKSDAKVGLLSLRHSSAINAAAARNYDAVSLLYKNLRRDDILLARSRGLQAYVWSPAKKRAISVFMTERGKAGLVDGIVTDSIPNALAAAREQAATAGRP